MKRFLKIAAAFMFMAVLFIGPAQAGYDHYTINVYKDVGYRSGSFGYPAITSGIQYFVLDKDLATEAPAVPVEKTIYNDRGLTEMRNPVWTDTFDDRGRIDFYVDDSDGYVDLVIVDNNGGFCLTLNDVPPSCHTAIIDERPNMEHHGKIWFTMGTSLLFTSISTGAAGHVTDTGIDTGIDFPALTMISEVCVEIIQAATDSADTILNVGLGSNLVALAQDIVADAGGWHEPTYTAVSTCGALLIDQGSGTHGDTPIGGDYVLVETLSLEYSLESGDGTQDGHGTAPTPFLAGWGFIHYWFTPMQ